MGPASAPELKRMCETTCKEMMKITARDALGDSTKITIKAPTDALANMRKSATEMRAMGESVKADTKDVAAQAGEKAGGMFGSVIGGLAAKAADVVGGVVGAGSNLVLGGMADAIDAAINKLDGEFSGVATELLEKKKDQVIAAYHKVTSGWQITANAVELCRGKEPWDEAAYNNCPTDSIAKNFMAASSKLIYDAMLPEVQEEINKSKVVKAWDATIESINAANEKVNELLGAEKKVDVVKLDINVYIVEQLVEQIGVLMGEQEAAVRKAPEGKAATCQATFVAIFSPMTVTKKVYVDFDAGK